MILLFSIASQRENFTANVIKDDKSIFFFADMDIDIDGSPDWESDPWGNPDTTLHYNGKPINTQIVRGIVLPPRCITAVKPEVIGCQAFVSWNGAAPFDAVVFDVGPTRKLGEGTGALARAIGANPDPVHGGIDDQSVLYRYFPGVPAKIDGIQYQLQPYRL